LVAVVDAMREIAVLIGKADVVTSWSRVFRADRAVASV
jgi:hypothetical protein